MNIGILEPINFSPYVIDGLKGLGSVSCLNDSATEKFCSD